MNKLLLGLPVDGRPVVRRQVQDLAAAGGWLLRMPEVAALGHMRQPADRDALSQWLVQASPEAAGLVISVDMLVYGGLVPSRFITDSEAELAARLNLLAQLKAAAPQRPLYAFAATMRISNNNVADEEKPYWATHGKRFWAWSFHSDRHSQTGDANAGELAQAARDSIPAELREDYLQTRARNHALNRRLLAFVQAGVIDRLVLPQDDTAEYGFNIAERRELQAEVAARGLGDRVLIYPGADEVMHTLCARMASALSGAPPLRVKLSCSDPAHVKSLRARYEDRPVLDSLASQLQAVGAVPAQPGEPADVLLALHSQGPQQGDWAMRLPLPEPCAPAPAWFEELRASLDGGLPLAVVDLAYANGGDPVLIDGLVDQGLLPRLSAYAGWNTASNSLGSLLAQLQLARGQWQGDANRLNLALRLAEDFLYQADLRQTWRDSMVEACASPAELLAQAQARVVPATDKWLATHGLPGHVQRCYLPWDRSFEIGLELAE